MTVTEVALIVSVCSCLALYLMYRYQIDKADKAEQVRALDDVRREVWTAATAQEVRLDRNMEELRRENDELQRVVGEHASKFDACCQNFSNCSKSR